MNAEPYLELLCSLPHLSHPFSYQHRTISYVQLRKRMNMLKHKHALCILELRNLFYWGRIAMDTDEEDLIERANRFLNSIQQTDVREWLAWRMDVRVTMAALRRRKQGEAAPSASKWAYGNYAEHIRRHWNADYFMLEHRFPFLPEAARLLQEGESFKLEKLLIDAMWNYCDTRQVSKLGSFSSVVLYVMKWDLINRWRQYDIEQGAATFRQLVANNLSALSFEPINK